jgi:hypothetical protein
MAVVGEGKGCGGRKAGGKGVGEKKEWDLVLRWCWVGREKWWENGGGGRAPTRVGLSLVVGMGPKGRKGCGGEKGCGERNGAGTTRVGLSLVGVLVVGRERWREKQGCGGRKVEGKRGVGEEESKT